MAAIDPAESLAVPPTDTDRPEEKHPKVQDAEKGDTATTADAPSPNSDSDNSHEVPKEVTSEEQDEENPPLPPGPPPGEEPEDDGWQPVWDNTYGSYYFYNSITGETTWTNPRVPDAASGPVGVAVSEGVSGGSPATDGSPGALPFDPLQYNPAIHGDYDPTAPYAQPREPAGGDYTATAAFNRFTGKFQSAASKQVPENYNDENKSRRQMEFYFDVDAAANSHDGKSLKAERQTRKLTKKELKAFKEKRRARKDEKRKAWLKD